jgi:hypothetical protein
MMLDIKSKIFHAVLEQLRPSLFRATYHCDFNPGIKTAGIALNRPHILPNIHTGTDAAAVKMRVEQLAASRGYTKVIWGELSPDAIAVPVSRQPANNGVTRTFDISPIDPEAAAATAHLR